MLNEEIPVNKYQKNNDLMSKLVERMFIKNAKIVGKTLKYFLFQC